MHKFPENFLWGTASSAHQIEGNNIHSDWWMWEQTKKYPNDPNRKYPLEPSGIACDSYNRYEEDLDYCVDMHNNAIRFGVEWARIEPEEGVFDQNQIEHYKRVIAAAKARGLKVMITLHHFSSPLWFAQKGGWVNGNCAHLFARYAKRCAQEFGETVDFYATINEPQVYTLMSYIRGIWYPGKKNPFLALMVNFNFIRSHRAAYDAIKSINPHLKIGIVKHIVWTEAAPSQNAVINFLNNWYAKLRFFLMTDFFLKPLGKKQDFIGLNY
ncbi:MAG: glycoside hydrolase family 1 protein, partial [Niabella sp.]